TYQIISMLDKLIDVIKNAARYARQLKTKPSEDSKKIARAILESYEVYYESYYKFDFKKINKIANLKAQVTQLLKKEIPRVSKEELLVLTELAQSLELHKAISEARMAIEF